MIRGTSSQSSWRISTHHIDNTTRPKKKVAAVKSCTADFENKEQAAFDEQITIGQNMAVLTLLVLENRPTAEAGLYFDTWDKAKKSANSDKTW